MHIISIGNSFSQNTTTKLRLLGHLFNNPLHVVNLYIPGCSLKMHYENIFTDERLYEYQIDGINRRMTSLSEVNLDEFDIITIQQFSGDSGNLSSVEPYLGEIIKYINKKAATSKIIYHKTWAYFDGIQHPHFYKYNHSNAIMNKKIDDVTDWICKKYNLSYIPMAEVVSQVSKNFNLKLSNDGYHLDTEEGKLVGALAWYFYLIDINQAYTSLNSGIINEEILFYFIRKVVNESINEIPKI